MVTSLSKDIGTEELGTEVIDAMIMATGDDRTLQSATSAGQTDMSALPPLCPKDQVPLRNSLQIIS
jgi:hypothetical protein